MQFEEGFSGKTVIGALFVAFIMLPGALYLGLVAGQGLGPAAEWVTIVLFAEIMRRSFLPLKRQEIYILYYIAAGLTGLEASKGISGGPFGGLIWNQYFVQSPPGAACRQRHTALGRAACHVGRAPAAHVLPPRLVLSRSCCSSSDEVLGRLNWMSSGYFLFRITSDIERLPFPMAPVAASGATALAEAASKEESWRWRVFSIGSVIGLIFGFFYIAIPVFTGVVFGKAFTLIPIPFFDLTTNTESILPGAVVGISGDLTKVLTGFIIPYHIVQGSLVGSSLSVKSGWLRSCRQAGAFGTSESQRLDAGHGRHLHQAGDGHQVLAVGRHRPASGGCPDRLLQRVPVALPQSATRSAGSRPDAASAERTRRSARWAFRSLIWLGVTVFYICVVQAAARLQGS